MLPLIIFGVIVIAPIVAALVLRVSAVFVFMSIGAGYLLQSALAGSVDLTLATVLKGSDSMVGARLGLLFLPVAATMIVLRKTLGKGAFFHLLPLVSCGLLLGALALPLLSVEFSQQIYDSAHGKVIKQSQDLVIAFAVIINTLLMWTIYKHAPSHHKKGH